MRIFRITIIKILSMFEMVEESRNMMREVEKM